MSAAVGAHFAKEGIKLRAEGRNVAVFADAVEQLLQERLAHHHGQDEVVQLVVLVDVGEERADYHTEAVARDGPRGVLAAGAGAEVLARHEYASAVSRIVQHKVLLQRAVLVVPPVAEEVVAEALLVGGLEEARGDNLVCVHVLQREWNARACYHVEFLFHCCLFPKFK